MAPLSTGFHVYLFCIFLRLSALCNSFFHLSDAFKFTSKLPLCFENIFIQRKIDFIKGSAENKVTFQLTARGKTFYLHTFESEFF